MMTAGLASCGGGQRQDVTESSGSFPVQVTRAKFSKEQQLAETSYLELAVKNVGRETVPNLTVTIFTLGTNRSESARTKGIPTSTGSGQGSFNVRLSEPNLANPNRPVWILESRYPKLLSPPAVTLKNVDQAPSVGAVAAQADTFQFGPVKPGDSKDIVWQLTAVRAGTYTVHYEISAGLSGKAKAVTQDGNPVKDQLSVTVSSKVPPSCVTGTGQVLEKARCPD